jgi:hypothetical protein
MKAMFRLATKMIAKAGGKYCYPHQGQQQVMSLEWHGFDNESDEDSEEDSEEEAHEVDN